MREKSLFTGIKRALAVAGKVVFPATCLSCGSGLLFNAGFTYPVCNQCHDRLLPPGEQRRCCVCSMPLVSEQSICTRCRQRQYDFGSHFSLFLYSGMIKELLYQYKFKNKKRLGLLLAELLADPIRTRYADKWIVPVPASFRSRRKRGWDHMAVIAGVLNRQYNLPVIRVLSRDKSRPQKALDFKLRLMNLRDKIHCKNPGPVQGRELLLLDDIFTTGATLSECARILLAAGAARVDALSLAID